MDLLEQGESIRRTPDDYVRVLVVEDEGLLQWSIGETLARDGMMVSQASDAASALLALSAEAFDVVLLDLCLPDARDLALLSKVRDLWPACAVVVMTAHATPEVIDGARRLGAHAILHKPFDLHCLPAILRAV